VDGTDTFVIRVIAKVSVPSVPPNFTQVPVPRNSHPETLLSPPYLPHMSRYLPHTSPYLPQSFGSGNLSHRVSWTEFVRDRRTLEANPITRKMSAY
jgi:hypothetical protein